MVAIDDDTRRGAPGATSLLIEGVVLAVAYLAFAAFILPALAGEGTFYGDVILNWFAPEKFAISERLAAGDLPMWSRSAFGGEPVLANLQHAVLYPGNLPFWFLRTSAALQVVVAAHLVWAGVGTAMLCRIGYRVSRPAGAIAGLVFAFGGYSLAHIVLMNQLQVLAWTPWVLLALHVALRTRRWRWTVVLGIAIGLQFLAGHPEEWVYTLVLVGGYAVAWGLRRPSRGAAANLRSVTDAVLRVGAAMVSFVLLFAWQLLPTLQAQSLGYRSDSGFRTEIPLPEATALNGLLPDYGTILIGENSAHLGVVGLVLAAVGLVGARGMGWLRWFALAASIAGFLLALGSQTAVFTLVSELVPILGDFRVQSRWLLLPYMMLSVAVALGVDVVISAADSSLRTSMTVAGRALALCLVAVAGIMLVAGVTGDATNYQWWGLTAAFAFGTVAVVGDRRVPAVAVVLLLAFALARELEHARPKGEWRQAAPGLLYDQYEPVLELLGQEGGRYVTSSARGVEEAVSPPVPEGIEGTLGQYYLTGVRSRLLAAPANQIATGAESMMGRDGGVYPTERYADWMRAALVDSSAVTHGNITEPPSGWDFTGLDFMGTRWWVTPDLPASEEAVLRANGFDLAVEYAYSNVWERDAPPIARLVRDITVEPDRERRLELVDDLPPDEALVEDAVPEGIEPGPVRGEVDVVELGDETVSLRVETDDPALLVLADPWYPGWSVTVDGEPADVERVNHAFRGVYVSAGEHDVEFHYEETGFWRGLLLSGAFALGLAVAALWLHRTGRFVVRRRDPDGELDATDPLERPTADGLVRRDEVGDDPEGERLQRGHEQDGPQHQ